MTLPAALGVSRVGHSPSFLSSIHVLLILLQANGLMLFGERLEAVDALKCGFVGKVRNSKLFKIFSLDKTRLWSYTYGLMLAITYGDCGHQIISISFQVFPHDEFEARSKEMVNGFEKLPRHVSLFPPFFSHVVFFLQSLLASKSLIRGPVWREKMRGIAESELDTLRKLFASEETQKRIGARFEKKK